MSCATLGFSTMINDLLIWWSFGLGPHRCLGRHGLTYIHPSSRAHSTYTRAHPWIHVQNENDSHARPCRHRRTPLLPPETTRCRAAHPGAGRSGIHGKGVSPAAWPQKGERVDRVHRRGDHVARGLRRIRTTRRTPITPSTSTSTIGTSSMPTSAATRHAGSTTPAAQL